MEARMPKFDPQRIGAVMLMVVGAGHLAIGMVLTWPTVFDWLSHGLWNAVPLRLPGASPDAAAIQNALVLWAGIGSFSVPSILLGALTWRLARMGVTPGVWIGAFTTLYFGIFFLLMPSPAILGVGAGLLFILASRASTQPANAPGTSHPEKTV
jgi:hypothetical protein